MGERFSMAAKVQCRWRDCLKVKVGRIVAPKFGPYAKPIGLTVRPGTVLSWTGWLVVRLGVTVGRRYKALDCSVLAWAGLTSARHQVQTQRTLCKRTVPSSFGSLDLNRTNHTSQLSVFTPFAKVHYAVRRCFLMISRLSSDERNDRDIFPTDDRHRNSTMNWLLRTFRKSAV